LLIPESYLKPSWSKMEGQIYMKLLQSNPKSSSAVAACSLPPKKKCFTLEHAKGIAKCRCQTSLTFTGSKEGFNQ